MAFQESHDVCHDDDDDDDDDDVDSDSLCEDSQLPFCGEKLSSYGDHNDYNEL